MQSGSVSKSSPKTSPPLQRHMRIREMQQSSKPAILFSLMCAVAVSGCAPSRVKQAPPQMQLPPPPANVMAKPQAEAKMRTLWLDESPKASPSQQKPTPN